MSENKKTLEELLTNSSETPEASSNTTAEQDAGFAPIVQPVNHPIETAASEEGAAPEINAAQTALPAHSEEKKRSGSNALNVNKVTLVGRVTKIANSATATYLTVCTYLTPAIFYLPTVKCTGALRKVTAGITVGQRVCVDATIASYSEEVQKTYDFPALQLIGRSIEVENVDTEKGIHDSLDSPLGKDVNEMLIRGVVIGIEMGVHKEATITVRTQVDKRTAILRLPYMPRRANEFYKNIHCGQRIIGKGMVQTANIPIDPEAEKAEESTVSASLTASTTRKHLRTKKEHYFVLYEVLAG